MSITYWLMGSLAGANWGNIAVILPLVILVCSAFSSFVVFFAHDKEGMMSITYWLMGSLAGANWGNIAVILPLVILCVLFFITQYRVLNLMLVGDEVSITLGTDLHKYRNFYLLVTSLMIGFIVYASGMIGFWWETKSPLPWGRICTSIGISTCW